MKQLNDNKTVDLEPINLGLSILKELGAKWLVQEAKYFEENPQITINGFIRTAIAGALEKTQVSWKMMRTMTIKREESNFGLNEYEEHNNDDVVEIRDD